jgi:hypothetical protein
LPHSKRYATATYRVVLVYMWQSRWLRHHDTNRKVVGSIPDEVIVFFNQLNCSDRTMALGSTQAATEMSTRDLPGVNGRPADKDKNLTSFLHL